MLDLNLIFEQLLDDFGAQMGPKMGPKNPSKICLGPPRAPQGRQRPPGGLHGAIWEPFGTHFRPIWMQFWTHLGVISAPPPLLFFPVLVSSFWLHPNNSGSAGVRVSAYNFCGKKN